ncbi:threonine ammonia-lyase [Sphingosinicella rhizophila]|uniref:Pyridoxal-phosphate dependent enzyme n=1 Tax=Sphingosinicella rhizophila TaxID=3050082 RepID=A0ABU3QAC3_9SPHN|nr:pyridoxal-phosphate dependent enzyme [Sphingosinicella sp. GR2756]MDT9600360.1 pyridoxal-phosphate dependent enzyme [Sphingosinicella sp. GR2756]
MRIPGLEDVIAARGHLADLAVRTPLLPFALDDGREVVLKPEILQPVGSFKIRCAGSAVMSRIARGNCSATFSTASAGNFAQGLAWACRQSGRGVTAYVPDTAATSKREALIRFGATLVDLPFADWWKMLVEDNDDPAFIHPVSDPDGLAGNATIGLEIAEDLPDAGTVLVPLGGGGLAVGVAAGLRAAGSKARVIICETGAGAPLTASLQAGHPVDVPFDSGTFITGMGGPSLLPSMWPALKEMISGTEVVPVAKVAEAVRLLAERGHMIAEGAGAASLAAAIQGSFDGPVVCVLSGGHLDTNHLIEILQGGVPRTKPPV